VHDASFVHAVLTALLVPQVTGNAVKYEDKSATTSEKADSKASEPKVDEKLVKVEDATTVISEVAEPKVVIAKESTATQAKASGSHEASNSIQEEERLPEGFVVEDEPSGPSGGELTRGNNSASQIALFTVGDFVKVTHADGTAGEGIILEVQDLDTVVVDFGAEGIVKQCLAANCELIVQSDTLEVGDQVQVQPVGSAMYFVGRVSVINLDGTYDVVMEGDDPDDIERSVPESNIRKLMSRRALVVARWKRAALVVSSMHNFQSLVMDPSMFSKKDNPHPQMSIKMPPN
jgi:hypothetical protein